MTESFTYTSPLTGRPYRAVLTNSAGWVHWAIFDQDTWVQFALTPDGVADSVAHYERPGKDIGSRFD